MPEFYSSELPLPHIPDDMTAVQFMLDYQHPIRPARNGITCLIEDKTGRKVTIEQLQQKTYALAGSLRLKYSIGDLDTVLICSPNHVDYLPAIWAIHRLGGIVTFSNPQFSVDELEYQLRTSKATFMIAHSTILDTALSAAHMVGIPSDRVILLDDSPSRRINVAALYSPAAAGLDHGAIFMEQNLSRGEGKTKIAFLCWSSGTTGKPKAVAISHYAFIANIIQMAAHNQVDNIHLSSRDARGYRPGGVAIGVLPFYHVAGLVINLHLVLFCAMTVVVVEKYSILDMLDSVDRYRITHLLLVPPQAIALCKHPAVKNYDLSMIKYVMIGAAPVSRGLQEELIERFPTAHIGQAYGLTEMTTTLAMVSPNQKRGPLGSGGRLLPGVQARVVKADGSSARYGERGELLVKGPSVALGYLHDQKATNETFVDGWLHTGDEVMITRNQEVFVFDRMKEMLKVNGFQVAPAELEGCLLSHPDIMDACVIGIPDRLGGDMPLACVVLSTDAVNRVALDARAADAIRLSVTQYVADRKVKHKHLKGGIRILASLPRSGSGKLLRRVLREDVKAKL